MVVQHLNEVAPMAGHPSYRNRIRLAGNVRVPAGWCSCRVAGSSAVARNCLVRWLVTDWRTLISSEMDLSDVRGEMMRSVSKSTDGTKLSTLGIEHPVTLNDSPISLITNELQALSGTEPANEP